MKKDFARILPYSKKVGGIADTIEEYKKEYMRLWWETDSGFPELGRVYDRKAQNSISKELFRFIDYASDRLDQYPAGKEEQSVWLEEFLENIRLFSRQFLDMSDLYLEAAFQRGFVDSTRIFVDRVKEFDPELRIENIYQALRNAWIMNSLQIYMNREVQFIDPIFAYSLIYPYTDNYLDSASESLEKKLSFISRLRCWLEGQDVPWEGWKEEKINLLIKMIEKHYERTSFPQVYQSLLAIFNAQLNSLVQQRGQILPFETDILGLSFEKGGASVLADGFLVNGTLEGDQSNFCFGFGVFLQLADDIQDLSVDKGNNHATVFSLPAGKYDLDKLANKLFRFVLRVVGSKLDSRKVNEKRLKELIIRNCYLLILEAIGKNKTCFSRDYVQRMQCHFPIRYSQLQKLREKLRKKLLGKREQVVDLNFVSAFLLAATSRIIQER